MIEEALKEVREALPLRVDSIDWQDPVLVVSGMEWNLRCSCAWRVSQEGVLLFGCWDREAGGRILDLIGLDLVEVSPQSSTVAVDPAFVASNGWRLELFSTDSTEPWVLRTPSGPVLVGSPSDKAAFS